jgi:hypothetical protein
MRLAKTLLPALLLAVFVPAAHADTIVRQERVPGGFLELNWLPGFATPRSLQALTLDPSDPAYANPSGDHTVGVATTTVADSGGIVLTCTDPAGYSDYTWEAWFFTGDGNTRRGLALRADPNADFTACYQFVIQSGLFQINFRKLVGQTPTTLGTWFANTLPGGIPQVNTWHHMKVIAIGPSFRCFFDDTELTTTPIVDNSLATGWVGVYNFRPDLSNVPAYFDDLTLTVGGATPATRTTWGAIKSLYRDGKTSGDGAH